MAPAEAQTPAPAAGQRPLDVLAVGRLERDLVLEVADPPSRDTKASGHFRGWYAGGPGANVSCGLAALGARTALLADVGDDEAGREVRAELADWGVDVSGVRLRSGWVTPVCVVMVHPDHTRTVLAMHGPDVAEIDRAAARPAQMARARLVHISTSHEADAVAVAAAATQAGCQTIIDVEGCTRADDAIHAQRLLDHADVALVTEPVLAALGASADSAGVGAVAARHRRIVIATVGARGALIGQPDGPTVHIPAASATPVDTTGAGDAFAAGLMVGLLEQRPVVDAAHVGAAVAAVVVEHVGARTGLPAAAHDARVTRARHSATPGPTA